MYTHDETKCKSFLKWQDFLKTVRVRRTSGSSTARPCGKRLGKVWNMAGSWGVLMNKTQDPRVSCEKEDERSEVAIFMMLQEIFSLRWEEASAVLRQQNKNISSDAVIWLGHAFMTSDCFQSIICLVIWDALLFIYLSRPEGITTSILYLLFLFHASMV